MFFVFIIHIVDKLEAIRELFGSHCVMIALICAIEVDKECES